MPPKYNLKTPVIFRVLDGSVIAILPTIPYEKGYEITCMGYDDKGKPIGVPTHTGQRARLATFKEFMPLKKRLQGMGYRLHVVKRIAAAHNKQRMGARS